MIVHPVEVQRTGDSVTRRARVEWDGDALDVELSGPATHVDATDDASAFLCATLPLAMRRGEDLSVLGPVSTRLARATVDLMAAYLAWDPSMHAVALELTEGAGGPAGSRRGAFFSRGGDSLHAAATDRAGERLLDELVFADGLEPRHDAGIAAQEVALAAQQADRLGLPLTVVRTNVRHLVDRFGVDWEDALGAGLSFVAHGTAGSLGSVVIPSSDSFASLEPCGSSPVLDPLFSTERVEIVHDSIGRSRLEKIRWLAAEAPALLADLKVCYAENRVDNCGRCGKCVHTMLCLRAVGALDRAVLFPDRIDPELVRSLRLPHLKARLDWAEVAAALDERGPDAELRRAVLDVLRASALPARYTTDVGDHWVPHRWMRDPRLDATLALVLEGRPLPRLDDATTTTPLVLCLDVTGQASVASAVAGAGPATGERLGTLLHLPLPTAVAVWVTPAGHVLTRGMNPPRSSRGQADPTSGPPTGYLHLDGGDGRRPLLAAWHRRRPLQLLATDPADVDGEGRRGYGPLVLLGYLDPPPD